MIRVAQVMGYMDGGGVEQVVMNYYRHVDRATAQFDLLVCEGSGMVPRDEVEGLGGRVLMVPGYGNLPRFMRALERLFRQERWPIVHSHVNALSVFPLCAAKRAGVLVRIAHSHSTSGRGEPVRNAMKAALRPLSNVYPTYRMACSRYAGEWLFGGGVNFEVLYNAIDLARFAFDAGVRVRVRAELGLMEGQLAVLHVGRFTEQKNHRFLIEAFAKASRRRPDAILLLAGEGDSRPSIERRVSELGLADRVKFLGQRSDVERLYSAADTFVLPSLYEGLPVVSVEAQASGLPCLLSDQITREVDVTGNVRFLPIVDSDLWADVLCTVRSSGRVGVCNGDFADYDIVRAGKRLTERYEELFERVRV
ncbi:glycosyl transferase family 1 [Olsenella sp. An285]|uniref:glycosyltransferase family 1 protein n=1 Tax=Olsenella sp. An285 TaxID=1965621 RepID=UPI000B39FA07|nr:glycosyltransferase family 1 protein [Olsenella sp. An285]OUO45398.1 glycosyl transferase family 1 [Olsenella sp. An285]